MVLVVNNYHVLIRNYSYYNCYDDLNACFDVLFFEMEEKNFYISDDFDQYILLVHIGFGYHFLIFLYGFYILIIYFRNNLLFCVLFF